MKILFATSEAYPFAMSGGLGDVAYALPKALRKKNIGVRVVLPLYSSVKSEFREKMKFLGHIIVPVAWRMQYCGIFEIKYDGVTYILLDNEQYFKRDSMYGDFDDGERFAFFSRAVLEIIPFIKFYPDIIHCNDWQTALIPAYYNFLYYNRPDYENIKTVLTIHNIAYQGRYGREILTDVIGIDRWASSVFLYDGDINYMKAGIECAHCVTTVSPTYAKEILDPWYSHELDGILKDRAWKLSGIVNGIDTDVYNPQTDKDLVKNYDIKTLARKKENKKALQKEAGLPVDDDIPLFSMVTRLVDHKGLDLLKDIFCDFLQNDVQLIILGTGDVDYEEFFEKQAAQYKDKFVFIKGFVPSLARRIYAGSDVFLMPSKSEPCGLAQMVSMRYGTIPLVRETGGLKDTVEDSGNGEGWGFTFGNYDANELLHAMMRAAEGYKNKSGWKKLVTRAMGIDNSWSKSAGEYVKLFKSLL